LKQVG